MQNWAEPLCSENVSGSASWQTCEIQSAISSVVAFLSHSVGNWQVYGQLNYAICGHNKSVYIWALFYLCLDNVILRSSLIYLLISWTWWKTFCSWWISRWLWGQSANTKLNFFAFAPNLYCIINLKMRLSWKSDKISRLATASVKWWIALIFECTVDTCALFSHNSVHKGIRGATPQNGSNPKIMQNTMLCIGEVYSS